MTETELFRAVHEYASTVAIPDSKQTAPMVCQFHSPARAKLLAAIHLWTEQKRASDIASLNRYCEIVGQLREHITGLNMQAEALGKRIPLLEAKAAVCDAVVAWEPEETRNSTTWNRVLDSIAALRVLQEGKP